MGQRAPLKPHRVLVVDDHRDVATTVATLLTLLGQNVEQAYDGPTALRIAGEFKPDVVFLDLVMPEMDGIAVGRQMRHLDSTRNAKIVALTAFSQPAFLEATSEAGFDAVISKPASAEELAKVLDS
jgi:CheY-like chemotaxis protein